MEKSTNPTTMPRQIQNTKKSPYQLESEAQEARNSPPSDNTRHTLGTNSTTSRSAKGQGNRNSNNMFKQFQLSLKRTPVRSILKRKSVNEPSAHTDLVVLQSTLAEKDHAISATTSEGMTALAQGSSIIHDTTAHINETTNAVSSALHTNPASHGTIGEVETEPTIAEDNTAQNNVQTTTNAVSISLHTAPVATIGEVDTETTIAEDNTRNPGEHEMDNPQTASHV